MRRFFCSLVKQAFWCQFGFHCPQNLHRIKDLSFLPHLMKFPIPWRHILLSDLQDFLQLSPEQWESCLAAPDLRFQEHYQLRRVGNDLLNYRIGVCQSVPTRLKVAFSWNMNSWRYPKSSREDPKMRRIKKLLKSGPVLLQETKWCRNQEEILLQHISGLQLATTKAIQTDSDSASGGAAILMPAGWVISQRIVLLQGRAIAVLVSDRSAPFYLISVYLHPDHVQRELEQILSAWRGVDKSDKVVLGGDFNQADVKCPDTWKKFLTTVSAVDVHPTLATYLYAGGSSALDRYLVPEDWVSTARWNPEVRTLSTSLTNGRKIAKSNVRVRPTVLNNPRDSKHETIPTDVFMPGKNGRVPKDNRSLQSLVRLLHGTHRHLFGRAIQTDGFRLGACGDNPFSTLTHRVPPFSDSDVPNQLLPIQPHSNSSAARELHSTRTNHDVCLGSEIQDVAVREIHFATHDEDSSPHRVDHGTHEPQRSNGYFGPADPVANGAENVSGDATPTQVVRNTHLSISACFWSWWRSLPPATNPVHDRPFLKARKFVHLPAHGFMSRDL